MSSTVRLGTGGWHSRCRAHPLNGSFVLLRSKTPAHWVEVLVQLIQKTEPDFELVVCAIHVNQSAVNIHCKFSRSSKLTAGIGVQRSPHPPRENCGGVKKCCQNNVLCCIDVDLMSLNITVLSVLGSQICLNLSVGVHQNVVMKPRWSSVCKSLFHVSIFQWVAVILKLWWCLNMSVFA